MNDRPHIVVGIDASWQNSGALDWALAESHRTGRPILAVHVIEEKLPLGATFTPPGTDKAAEHLVADVAAYLAGHDGAVGHRTEMLTGNPAATLVETATTGSVLVVGRRGTSRLARLLIGSTAEAVTHLAAGPVVVVPDRWHADAPGAPIVVGVDEAEETDEAIAFAMAAAAGRGAPVRLVRVWDLPSIYTWDAAAVTDLYDGWHEQSSRRLQAMADEWRVRYPELEIHAETRRGHPVGGLVAAAEESKAELLVLGGRAHRRVTEMLLGSTARGVLHHAPCPVAVVHEPRGGH
jgi:nucleotide-binding universal stress UspA family protein